MPRPAPVLRLLLLSALLTAGAAGAAQPQLWRLEGARDFLAGELQGLAVDSDGHLRLASRAQLLQDPEQPYVWCLAADRQGRVYVGTGNDGKVFVIEKGQGRLLFDAPELEVHALAVGPDGRLYVGTAPDGKVYRVDERGVSEVFVEPGTKYVWALAFDRQERLLVATGSPARLLRVGKDGQSEIVLSSPEAHFTALALDEDGQAYVGTAPGAIVYRVDTASKAFALVDTPYREVKALAVGHGGAVYAAVLDSPRDLSSATPAAAPSAPSSTTSGGEVTVTESFSLPALPVVSAVPPQGVQRAAGKGAVLRLMAGDLETLWSSPEEAPHALVVTADGVLVGTGDKGRLYRVRDDQSWSMEGTLAGEQLTALVTLPDGNLAAAVSNPGKVFLRQPARAAEGAFTSAIKDTDAVSAFGLLRWEGELPGPASLALRTRSGNTATPDSTWSDWSAPYTRSSGQPVASPKARFVQVEARLVDSGPSGPRLDSLALAFLQRNLRPQVTQVIVHPPGEGFQKPLSASGEIEVLGLDPPDPSDPREQAARASQPAATTFSRKVYQRGLQTLSWKAEDANQDALAYDLLYRRAGETAFRPLRRGLTDQVYAWDTMSLPDGRYVVKVVASDAPSNPESLALAGDKESASFEVDNTPPLLEARLAEPGLVRVKARDAGGNLRRAEFSVDGQRWQEVHPQDGINDGVEEVYDIRPRNLGGPGPHVVVVRVTDQLGNRASARVDLP